MLLKRIAPKSLFGRFMVIIIVPTVLVQLVATYMFYERHWSNVSRYLAGSLSGEVMWVVKELEARPQEADAILEKASAYFGLASAWRPRHSLGGGTARNLPETDLKALPEAFNYLYNRLETGLSQNFYIDIIRSEDQIYIAIELEQGILELSTSRKRVLSSTTYIFILWMTGTALVLLVVSLFFVRGQVRSIRRLAKAAESFGRGEEDKDYKPQGALEVRQAGNAFLRMKERISRFIQQRTDMLAGISHDLRTPLTRMKLQLAMAKHMPEKASLEEDIDEMEAMLNEYVDFLRGVGHEKPVEVQLRDFLRDIVKDYMHYSADVDFHASDNPILLLRKQALKRCISNLINNAIRYSSRVVVNLEKLPDAVIITVDDNGPGIPPEQYEAVFQPFYRLDSSRNHETGGAGLGLAIVRDIVQSHGGEIALDKSALGGLRVVITLPGK